MNNIMKRQLDAFDRVVEFGANYPLVPGIAAVTALYTGVGNAAIVIRGHKGDQESGRGCNGNRHRLVSHRSCSRDGSGHARDQRVLCDLNL